jgi:hypothetical protein
VLLLMLLLRWALGLTQPLLVIMVTLTAATVPRISLGIYRYLGIP